MKRLRGRIPNDPRGREGFHHCRKYLRLNEVNLHAPRNTPIFPPPVRVPEEKRPERWFSEG